MKVQEKFSNVFSYAYGVENWVKSYFKEVGFNSEYTFVSDFACVDWLGNEDDVKSTYESVQSQWLSDYKAFTELVMSINLLAWANDKLLEQGFEDREKWIDFYNDLYYQAKGDFYDRWGDNDEACEYFFRCMD